MNFAFSTRLPPFSSFAFLFFCLLYICMHKDPAYFVRPNFLPCWFSVCGKPHHVAPIVYLFRLRDQTNNTKSVLFRDPIKAVMLDTAITRGEKTPGIFSPPLVKCVGHSLKDLGPSQKTLRSPCVPSWSHA